MTRESSRAASRMMESESRFNQPGRNVIAASSNGEPSEPDVLPAQLYRVYPIRTPARHIQDRDLSTDQGDDQDQCGKRPAVEKEGPCRMLLQEGKQGLDAEEPTQRRGEETDGENDQLGRSDGCSVHPGAVRSSQGRTLHPLLWLVRLSMQSALAAHAPCCTPCASGMERRPTGESPSQPAPAQTLTVSQRACRSAWARLISQGLVRYRRRVKERRRETREGVRGRETNNLWICG